MDQQEVHDLHASLEQREELLRAVNFAAAGLLATVDWSTDIEHVLAVLGAASRADRMYVFQNHRGPSGELLASQRFEWSREAERATLDSPELQGVPYVEGGMGRWHDVLSAGGAIAGPVDELPESERDFLEPQGIRSLAVVPIVVGRGFWGFMGFDDCREPREWDTPLVDALRAAANTVGTAIYRRDTEAELARSREQLARAQRMQSMGRLASGIAHDFNNVLTLILGYASTLQSDSSLPGPARQDVAEIEAAASRAQSLTSQLLAFGRRRPARPVPTALPEALEETARMISRLLPAGIELQVETRGGEPPALVDRGQLEQVVMNLVINARDAMKGQGGRIRVRTASTALGPAAALRIDPELAAGRYCWLEVEDEGPGVPPECRALIFEPFFTTKPEGEGTGLGLSVVHGIVHGSGGAIELRAPRSGRGACFRVYLPAAPGG